MPTTSVRFNMTYLETQVDERAQDAGINPTAWARFRATLAELKSHNQLMYAHSLRVGLYCYGLAAFEDQTDLRFPLFAGCGHDMGKCNVPNSLLDSPNLQPHEFESIKQHTEDGFNRLKDDFPFTALIAGLHHKYRTGGYGIELDDAVPVALDEASKQHVIAMAKLVMLADFFDALTTRNDDKGFITRPDDPTEQFEVMTEHFPNDHQRVKWLIANRIM
jgi:response regulator RpfG family c-di-GMP phosphodiesterase